MKQCNALIVFAIVCSNLIGCSSGNSSSSFIAKIGEPLQTDFFTVTVEARELAYTVNTGNPYTGLPQDEGHIYLLIKVSYKNTDNESRMIDEGSVIINYNGRDYEFDKSEPIMDEGWGIFLDQINPLTTKTTRLVYKIPVEINGQAYYRPGRNSDGGLIHLGEIKIQ